LHQVAGSDFPMLCRPWDVCCRVGFDTWHFFSMCMSIQLYDSHSVYLAKLLNISKIHKW